MKIHTPFIAVLLAAGVSASAFPANAQLSPVEQKIVAAVKARSEAALQFLERTVNINSGTMNHDGVRKVGKMFSVEFAQLGFATRWAQMPAEMQRAGHLIATREGKQGKRLLLIGHLDTVFEKDSPVQPWDRIGDTVRGQGVSDMKGGDVIVVEALRALQSVGALDNTTISVVFSGDEERVGTPIAVARADMIALEELTRRRFAPSNEEPRTSTSTELPALAPIGKKVLIRGIWALAEAQRASSPRMEAIFSGFMGVFSR